MQPPLHIGTRGSQLALWQANWVRDQIRNRFPEKPVELVVIKTQGDHILDRTLAKIGGKGLFVKELEVALREGRIDMAVHSMKDVPALLPEGLEISIISFRETPHDGLIAPQVSDLKSLPPNAIVGTSSLRRSAQLKAYRPDLQIKNLRGNVDTRLAKVLAGEYDAAVMAVAGMKRLGLAEHIKQTLPFSIMLPAIAQGVLGIETRVGDEDTLAHLHHIHDPAMANCIEAERAALQTLEGNCQIPIAGFCEIQQEHLQLTLLIATPDGQQILKRAATAPRAHAHHLGQILAQELLDNGGRTILALLNS